MGPHLLRNNYDVPVHRQSLEDMEEEDIEDESMRAGTRIAGKSSCSCTWHWGKSRRTLFSGVLNEAAFECVLCKPESRLVKELFVGLMPPTKQALFNAPGHRVRRLLPPV